LTRPGTRLRRLPGRRSGLGLLDSTLRHLVNDRLEPP
jgi:hypothetical protein